MRGLRRTEKFKTDKPSNLNRSESEGEPAKPKGRPGRTGQPLRGEPDVGERKNRELSTRAGRGKPGSASGTGAPKEPLPGEIGKKGKAGAES